MTLSDESLFRCQVDIPIRYGDINMQRHLSNVAYFTIMEQARVAYIREVGLWDEYQPDGVTMIVAEATCTYLASAYLWETVIVSIRVSHLGNKSFHFDYRLATENGPIATGRTAQVCFDYGRQESVPVPDSWRRAITDYEPGLTP